MSKRSTVMVSKSLKSIGVVTVIASVMWTGLAVYNAASGPEEIEVEQGTLEPISAILDMDTLNSLAGRRQMAGSIDLEKLFTAQQPEIQQVEPISEPDQEGSVEAEIEPETQTSTTSAQDAL